MDQRPDLLDRTFRIGILLKGLDGVLELVGGALLLVLTPDRLHRIVHALTQHDLPALDRVTGAGARFAAVYLILHGLVKVVLVVALLRNQLWAYPWMIGFLVAFIGYQLYRLVLDGGLWLVGLTLFDAAVAWLTWREYGRQRAHRTPL